MERMCAGELGREVAGAQGFEADDAHTPKDPVLTPDSCEGQWRVADRRTTILLSHRSIKSQEEVVVFRLDFPPLDDLHDALKLSEWEVGATCPEQRSRHVGVVFLDAEMQRTLARTIPHSLVYPATLRKNERIAAPTAPNGDMQRRLAEIVRTATVRARVYRIGLLEAVKQTVNKPHIRTRSGDVKRRRAVGRRTKRRAAGGDQRSDCLAGAFDLAASMQRLLSCSVECGWITARRQQCFDNRAQSRAIRPLRHKVESTTSSRGNTRRRHTRRKQAGDRCWMAVVNGGIQRERSRTLPRERGLLL